MDRWFEGGPGLLDVLVCWAPSVGALRKDVVPSGLDPSGIYGDICAPFSILKIWSRKVVLVVVVPKFNMQCYESKMTAKDVILLAQKYIVPLGLHPSASTEGWTMNQLPSERVVPDAIAWRHHDSDVYDAFSDNDFSIQDIGTLSERIIDLRPVPPGLVFGVGLATTRDFPGFFPVFKDTGGNVVTKAKYLPFPFFSRTFIEMGFAIPFNRLVGQHNTLPLPADQHIPNKTDNQVEVKVEDPKVIASCEKKKAQAARAATKNKENKRENDKGGSSKLKRRKIPAKPKGAPASSGRVSSPTPLRTVPPVNQIALDDTGHNDGEPNHLSSGAPTSRPRQILTGRNIKEGESSRGASNLLADYDTLADTHAECSKIVRKYVTARVDLEHNSKLDTDAINRYKVVKEEHSGCGKDSTLTYAERMLAEWANDHEKLTAELGQAKIKKFDCIRKLLPTVVSRLLKSHEYKNSLSEPLNMATQDGWGKGLSEGRTNKETIAFLHKAEDFDPYSDKKLYPMYNKLFEKEYPYVEKIASGYRHSVADLLKVHPDPAPFKGTSTPTISKALSGFGVPPSKKT
ncbi:hypothetical protein Tco_0394853 [Tanacetum coccineum]